MQAQHYDLAYQKLTDYLLHFCVSRIYGTDNAAQEHPRTFGGHTGFVSPELNGDTKLIPGDLLLLSGHRDPKWRMAWLVQIREDDLCPGYLVQSAAGEGEVTWMSNVEVAYFHRPVLQQHPEWKWTNEQHLLAERWMTHVSRHRDTQLLVPMQPVFLGDSVTLRARARFGLDDYKPSITVSDFRSLDSADLLRCYDELCQKHDIRRSTRKEVIP